MHEHLQSIKLIPNTIISNDDHPYIPIQGTQPTYVRLKSKRCILEAFASAYNSMYSQLSKQFNLYGEPVDPENFLPPEPRF